MVVVCVLGLFCDLILFLILVLSLVLLIFDRLRLEFE